MKKSVKYLHLSLKTPSQKYKNSPVSHKKSKNKSLTVLKMKKRKILASTYYKKISKKLLTQTIFFIE